jgi:hypothetical protein
MLKISALYIEKNKFIPFIPLMAQFWSEDSGLVEHNHRYSPLHCTVIHTVGPIFTPWNCFQS